jgi:type III secretion protein L
MSDGSVANLTSLPRSPGRRVVRAAEAQNWIDGYRFVEEARRCSDELTQSARTAYEEAKTRGFEEGRNAGSAEAAAIVADTNAKVDRYLSSIESQLTELSLAIVERVIGRFDDADIVARTAAHALTSFRREKHLKIRVSPELVEDVERALSVSLDTDHPQPSLAIEGDPQLSSRQCRIVSEFAVIDASLDAQLDIIRRMGTASGDAPA